MHVLVQLFRHIRVCVCDFTHKRVAEAHLCVCCGEGCCCDLAACRFLAHAHTHMHAHARVRGTSKDARFTACAHTHVCCTNKECTWSCFRLLWLFRLHVQISFSHPVSLAVLWQILGHVISRRGVLRQHGVCGRGSGLWCSFVHGVLVHGLCWFRFVVFVSGVWCCKIVCCAWWWGLWDLLGRLGTCHLTVTHTGRGGAALRKETVVSDCAHTCVLQKQGIRGYGSVAWVVV